MTQLLSTTELKRYQEDGFLVLRDVVEESVLRALDKALEKHVPNDGPLPGIYPAPGRYTLATSALNDPTLAQVAYHPKIVQVVSDALSDDPVLTAFVMYDRTPGGPDIRHHNDYKRWRPVGSSMDWLFAILPLDDFDENRGQLFLYPGSHHLERIHPFADRFQDIEPALFPEPDAFIDPELRRGDLCLMNMHTWHKANGNKSTTHRRGFFNKYAARHYPPATGYYKFSTKAYDNFPDSEKHLLPTCSDKPITQASLLLQNFDRFYIQNGSLPVSPAVPEQAIPDWDLGNYIASAIKAGRDQVRVEPPWVSWITDVDNDSSLSRMYGYNIDEHAFPARFDGEWLTKHQLQDRFDDDHPILDAIELWQDPALIRGKGVTQARARTNQYAC